MSDHREAGSLFGVSEKSGERTVLRVGLFVGLLAGLFFLGLGMYSAPVARAASYPCTEIGLNSAITTGGDATFSCSSATTIAITNTKTISLNNTNLDGGGLLTIDGINVPTATGTYDGRIFNISSGITATIQGMTITNGKGDASYNGGAIFNEGTLLINNDYFKDNGLHNIPPSSQGAGGAIDSIGPGLYLSNSTFSGNNSNFGHVIYMAGGSLSIDNSTIANNGGFAGNNATTIDARYVSGPITVTNSTFNNNIATFGDLNSLPNVPIIYQNTIATYIPDNGRLQDLGNNLIGGDAKLSPLTFNGGSVPTMSLQACSPAINAGNNAWAPLHDQRGIGYARIKQNVQDIGAFESDLLPCLAVGDVSQAEGNSGTTNFAFPVTLSSASSGTVTVAYTTANGTATSGSDYNFTSGTLTFAPYETSETITVPVNGDTTYENNESFFLNLSSPTDATLTDGQGLGTILNDDNLPSLSIADNSQNEGGGGAVSSTFTVTLSTPSVLTATVNYSTTNGTALAGEDYTAKSGTLTFAPGTVTQTISIDVQGDSKYERDETFQITLSGPTAATISRATATGTILNDDGPPSINIDDPSVVEGNSGTTPITFTVTLNSASDFTATVQYTTADSSANAVEDYTTITGTLTFNPGETSKQVVVQVKGDTKYEIDETFSVNLSSADQAVIGDNSGTGTIQNDDTQPVISISNISMNEGNSGSILFTFTISLTNPSYQTVGANYTLADGTAVIGEDFPANNGSFSVPPGQITRTLTIQVNGDTKYEPDETFTVNLFNPVFGTLDPDHNIGTGTILNDDNPPAISIADVSKTEGNSGTSSFVFTVALSTVSAYTTTVNYTTADSTATAGSDYIATSGTLTFAPGVTTQPVTVQVNGDTTYEPDEAFVVNLTNPGNATIGDGQGLGSINNDDTAPTLAINDISQNEGDSGTTPFVFTVTLSQASGFPTTVAYATANDTATTGSDYTSTAGTLTFPAGTISQTITVLVNGDTLPEPDETFFVNLSEASNATITDGQGRGTITNDDGVPSLSIEDVSQAEGNSGTTAFTFTANLNKVSALTTTVNYATANGTATAGADYTATSGTLTFAPGVTTQNLTVLVNGDTVYEPDETFYLNLTGPANATIADGQGLGTIVNDEEAPPGVSIEDVSLAEGNSGTTPFAFTVTLAEASEVTATVNYTTLNGSATAPSDYSAANGTLTFAPGVVTQTVTVLVNGDTLAENNESFTVKLSAPGNTSIGKGEGAGVIINDDARPPLSVSNVSQKEGNSGVTPFVFTVTLDQPSGLDTNLSYSTEDGTATVDDNDYHPVTDGTATIPAGQTSTTITILVNGDTTIEDDETFNLNIQMTVLPSSAQANAPLPQTTGVGTIINDDFKKNDYQPPADLIGQLLVTPDRVAANDSQNEIRYTFTVKNVGQGKAGAVSLTFPVDLQLVLGYGEFVNPNVWVTSVSGSEITVNLPGIEYNGVVTGTLIFRPNSETVPTAGSAVSSRYALKWTNPADNNGQASSNAVSFVFGETGSNTDVSGGLIQLMMADAPTGTTVVHHSNFWIPNEKVTAWLTAPDGTSTILVTGSADAEGNFTITVDSANLAAGTYVVAAFGARSEIYGSGVLVIEGAGSSRVQAAPATNLRLNSLGARALEVAPAKP